MEYITLCSDKIGDNLVALQTPFLKDIKPKEMRREQLTDFFYVYPFMSHFALLVEGYSH
jgi:hypothetical protein